MRGRFAPSPTGPLHVGNLRTALVAFLSAAHQHGELIVRMEDLDPVTSSLPNERVQLADLRLLGVQIDGAVTRQSERFDLYRSAIAKIAARGLVYECFCTRREIRDAASAPNGGHLPDGAYPGTCRELSILQRRTFEREGRGAALRLRTNGETYAFDDRVAGRYAGGVDDVVLQRNDGVPAYNLAVVVDDSLQDVTEVVRGDDLLSSTPRQLHLQRLLGFSAPAYAHVPLVVGADGVRLAKRHGAVTLADLSDRGTPVEQVLEMLAESLGLQNSGGWRAERSTRVMVAELAGRFSWTLIPREPWTFGAV